MANLLNTSTSYKISGTLQSNPILTLSNSAGSVNEYIGTGTPESVIVANVGDKYTDLTTGITYTKNAGSGNTGWSAVLTGNNVTSNTTTVNKTTHGFVVGDVLRISTTDNVYVKAQANSLINSQIVGIVTSVIDVNNYVLTTDGFITSGVPTNTSNTLYYLSPSVAGTLTTTAPTTNGQVVKPFLIVIASGTKAFIGNFTSTFKR